MAGRPSCTTCPEGLASSDRLLIFRQADRGAKKGNLPTPPTCARLERDRCHRQTHTTQRSRATAPAPLLEAAPPGCDRAPPVPERTSAGVSGQRHPNKCTHAGHALAYRALSAAIFYLPQQTIQQSPPGWHESSAVANRKWVLRPFWSRLLLAAYALAPRFALCVRTLSAAFMCVCARVCVRTHSAREQHDAPFRGRDRRRAGAHHGWRWI